MKLVCYRPEYAGQWNDFIKRSKNGLFMFDRNYMDYHSDRFTDHSLMVIGSDEKIVAVLPANKRDATLYSHQGLTFGGFVTDTGMKAATMVSIFELLKSYMQEQAITKLVYKAIPHMYHQQPAEEDLYALFRAGAVLFRTDVSSTINLRDRIGFSDLRKRGAKKAEKNGVSFSSSNDWSGYMSLLSSVLQDRHDTKPVHSAEEMSMLSERFPDSIKLYTATKDGAMLAGVVIFEYGHMVHAQYIGATVTGREMGALDGLFVYLITQIYVNKAWFDFGISTEQAGTFLNEGLISQKEGFGARSVVHQFFEMAA